MKVVNALLILVLLSSCEQSSQTTVSQQAAVKKTTESQPIDDSHSSLLGQEADLSNITITNFKQVDAGVFRGARPTKEQILELASIGVRTVIDLQGGDGEIHGAGWVIDKVEPGESAKDIAEENQEVLDAGILNFYNEPMNSFEDVSADEAVKIQTALEIISDPTKQPVFVHCQHGKDRTGLVMALYRVDFDQWTPEAAHDEMIQMGHTGELDHLFTGRLDQYFYKVTGWQPGQK